jgi:hypothetical protein
MLDLRKQGTSTGRTVKMASDTIIDMDRARELLDRAVQEKGGDYVDPDSGPNTGCVNVKRDENGELCPSCIVGHVFFYAGVSLQFLSDYCGDVSVLSKAVNEHDEGVKVTRDAAIILKVAQMHQDGGGTWLSAVDRAEGMYCMLQYGGDLGLED